MSFWNCSLLYWLRGRNDAAAHRIYPVVRSPSPGIGHELRKSSGGKWGVKKYTSHKQLLGTKFEEEPFRILKAHLSASAGTAKACPRANCSRRFTTRVSQKMIEPRASGEKGSLCYAGRRS